MRLWTSAQLGWIVTSGEDETERSDSREAEAETWRQMNPWAEEEEGKSGGWWTGENEVGGLTRSPRKSGGWWAGEQCAVPKQTAPRRAT